MRPGRVLLVCALVLSSAAVVRADGFSPDDPKILIGRGLASTPVTTLGFFPIGFDSSGGGVSDFNNATGEDWIGLTVDATFKNASDAKAFVGACNTEVITDIFSSCTAVRHGNTVTFTLSGGGVITPCLTEPSCPMNSEFFLDLNNGDTFSTKKKEHNGSGGWIKGDTIFVEAITTPEPGSLLLLLSGLGGVWLWRKRASRLSGRLSWILSSISLSASESQDYSEGC